MFVVVAMNLSVTLETNGDRVADIVVLAAFERVDVIGLDLYSTKTVADAATPVASDQQFGNFIYVEGHGEVSYPPLSDFSHYFIAEESDAQGATPYDAHITYQSRQDALRAVAEWTFPIGSVSIKLLTNR